VALCGSALGLTLLHLAIDGSKIQLGRRTPAGEGAAAFVVDQAVHFVTIVVAACRIARVDAATVLRRGFNRSRRRAIAYCFCWRVCGGDLRRGIPDSVHDQAAAEAFAGGRIATGQRGYVHRVAGAIFGDDRIDFALTGDRRIDFGGEIDCTISGVQTGRVC
jgi:hypothetical protein